MKPLILTSWLALDFLKPEIADLAVNFNFHFVWGPLPSADDLAVYLGPRSYDEAADCNWSTFAARWGHSENKRFRDHGMIEFCQHYEAVELWFDTNPEAQLQLVWLLDYFRSCPAIAAKLKLRRVDLDMIGIVGEFGKWWPRSVDVTERELATASAAWQAYRAATPEACFDLLRRDLSALPLLRPVLFDLLAELPSASTGLGATEMRMLELIAQDCYTTNALFYLRSLRQTRVFSQWGMGDLLEGMAFGPQPAITGLDDELRTMDRENLRDRQEAYLRSAPRLTEFGKAVLAHKEDFSQHNPIDRWWGGTHLTNERLWRWDPVLTAPAELA